MTKQQQRCGHKNYNRAFMIRCWCIAATVIVVVTPATSFVVPSGQSPALKSDGAGRRRYWEQSSSLLVLRPAAHSINESTPAIAQQEESSASASSPTKTKRRKRKNKYDTFSKVKPDDKDPLEELMEESTRKNQVLVEEEQQRRRRMNNIRRGGLPSSSSSSEPTAPVVLPPPPELVFPDTTTIDPYDPQTFGYIELAHVKGAHGVHGWVKVVASKTLAAVGTEQRERWLLLCGGGDNNNSGPTVRYLKPLNKRAPRQIWLLSGRPAASSGGNGHDDYLLSIEGVEDRNAAELLRGATLYARQEQLEEEKSGGSDSTKADEELFAVADLVGLEVFLHETNRQAFVGKVGGVVFSDDIADIPGLGHDYLELILPRGLGGTFSLLRDELVLIPLVPQLVPVVNIQQGIIEIDPPEGLLDLTYVREEKTRIKAFLPSSSLSSSSPLSQ